MGSDNGMLRKSKKHTDLDDVAVQASDKLF